MWFGILGAVEARSVGGEPVALGGQRQRGLLAMLLLDAGRVVPTGRLISGLYGDRPPAGAANALQAQVSRLRKALGAELVELHPAGYRLAVDPDAVDAHRFTTLTAAGRKALAEGDHAGAAASLRAALELWRGPALADVAEAPFAPAQVTRLAELRLAAVEDAAEARLALGEHAELVPSLRELVAEHPLRERAVAQLMRALHGCGRQAEALAAFERARTALAEELGADPSAGLAEVHLAVLRAEPAAAPRRGLPAQISGFVGRADELARLHELLGTARLVTVTGPGGAGKTRLAVEAAGRQRGEVCFADLAPLTDGADLPRAVLGALGLREPGLLPTTGGSVQDRLVAALSETGPLLVLDNCEHVVDAAAGLVHRLLGACPGLRVLATSREALGITGEALCPLAPLAVPPEGASAADALGYPAVRLFADRAAAVAPGFAVTGDTVAAVGRICTALDGLPLAVELAAARLRSMPVEQVAARLGDRFGLLSRGDRTAAPRHRTLRAVVEWSWDLLDEQERLLATRLTVFAGGATPEAAERVCGLGPATADLLAGLAEKSLLEVTGGRYRMLETIREFGAERLAGEADRLRRAHAGYFLDLARTADPHLRRHEQLAWLGTLDAEHGNLRAALRWAVAADHRLALHLFGALSPYWFLRGLRGEVAPAAAGLLAALGTEPPAGLDQEYVLCVLNAGPSGVYDAELGPHRAAAEEIMAKVLGPTRQPFLLAMWAMAHGPPADLSRFELHDFGDDPWLRALGRFSTGYFRLFRREVTAAEEVFGPALDGFRAVGDRWGMAQALDALATFADWRADRDAALALTDEALVLFGELDAVEELAELRCRRGSRLAARGRAREAAAEYELAVELARRAGLPVTVATGYRGLGELARSRGEPGEARRLFERALETCAGDWANASARLHALLALGRLAADEGGLAEAAGYCDRALRVALEHRVLPPDLAEVAEAMARPAVLAGDAERAATLLGAGTAIRGVPLAGDAELDGTAAMARDTLGAARYTAAFDRAALLSPAAATALLDGTDGTP